MANLSKLLDAEGGSRPVITIPIAGEATVNVGDRAYTDGKELIELKDDTFLNHMHLNDNPSTKYNTPGYLVATLPNGSVIVMYGYSPYTDLNYHYLEAMQYSADGELLASVRDSNVTSNGLNNFFYSGAKLLHVTPDGSRVAFVNVKQNAVARLVHIGLTLDVDGLLQSINLFSGPDAGDYFRQLAIRDPLNDDYFWTTTNDDIYLHKANLSSNYTQGAKFQYTETGSNQTNNFTYNRTINSDYDTLEGGVAILNDSNTHRMVIVDLSTNGSYGEGTVDLGTTSLNSTSGSYWFNISSTAKGVIHYTRTTEDNTWRWRVGEVQWDNATRQATFIDHGPLVVNNTITGEAFDFEPNDIAMNMDMYYDDVANTLRMAFASTQSPSFANDTKRGIVVADFTPGVSLGEFEGNIEVLYETDSVINSYKYGIVCARNAFVGMSGGSDRLYAGLSLTKKIGNRQAPPTYVGIVTEVNGNEASVKLKSGGGISEYFVSDDEPVVGGEWMKIDGTWFQKSSTTESYAIAGGIEGNRITNTSFSDESLTKSIGVIQANLASKALMWEAKLDIQGLGSHHVRMTLPLDTGFGSVRRALVGCSDGIVSGGDAGALYNTSPSAPTIDLYVNTFSSAIFGAVYKSDSSSVKIPVSYDVEIK